MIFSRESVRGRYAETLTGIFLWKGFLFVSLDKQNMTSDEQSQTSLSLLIRLKNEPIDDDSWAEFVRRYQPLIQRWCGKWGLQNADAADVTQDVLLKIARCMSRFEYNPDGGFRKWLRKVTYHAWCDHLTGRKWSGAGGDAIRAVFESAAARDNLIEMIEEEYTRQMILDARATVRPKVESHIWEAFELMTQGGLSAQQVAQQLQISVGNAYVCKSRVQKMLAEEISRMEANTS